MEPSLFNATELPKPSSVAPKIVDPFAIHESFLYSNTLTWPELFPLYCPPIAIMVPSLFIATTPDLSPAASPLISLPI